MVVFLAACVVYPIVLLFVSARYSAFLVQIFLFYSIDLILYMALTWIQALKKWNEHNENWCVPRKDTEGYNEVMALMKGETPKKVKKEK